MNLASFNLSGQRLAVKDSMLMLSEGEREPEWPSVLVRPGEYLVEAKIESDVPVLVRCYRRGSTPLRGQEIGVVEIDHASAVFFDYEALRDSVQARYLEYEDWTSDEMFEVAFEVEPSAKVAFAGCEMVVVRTGAGDGVYSVFELTAGDEVVGLECDFVLPEHPEPVDHRDIRIVLRFDGGVLEIFSWPHADDEDHEDLLAEAVSERQSPESESEEGALDPAAILELVEGVQPRYEHSDLVSKILQGWGELQGCDFLVSDADERVVAQGTLKPNSGQFARVKNFGELVAIVKEAHIAALRAEA